MGVEKISNLKELYSKYRFNCHCEGDIWNEDHEPYSFKEWCDKGYPMNGGREVKKMIFKNNSKFS